MAYVPAQTSPIKPLSTYCQHRQHNPLCSPRQADITANGCNAAPNRTPNILIVYTGHTVITDDVAVTVPKIAHVSLIVPKTLAQARNVFRMDLREFNTFKCFLKALKVKVASNKKIGITLKVPSVKMVQRRFQIERLWNW